MKTLQQQQQEVRERLSPFINVWIDSGGDMDEEYWQHELTTFIDAQLAATWEAAQEQEASLKGERRRIIEQLREEVRREERKRVLVEVLNSIRKDMPIHEVRYLIREKFLNQ